MEFDYKNLISALESILFVYASPITKEKIAEILECSMETVDILITHIQNDCAQESSGIELVSFRDKYQFISKKSNSEYVKKTLEIKNNSSLSSAALETLAIIAYNQPVTKNFIEQVRGVDCGQAISNLVKRELIEEDERLPIPGRPISYKTTDNFLICFELESLDDLPLLPEKIMIQQEKNCSDSSKIQYKSNSVDNKNNNCLNNPVDIC